MVAQYHRRAVEACADLGARLVAVGHPNPARDEQIAADFGVPRYDPPALLLDPAIDVVCICTPSGQHAAEAIAALQSGKHVLVEKPMALGLADADAMIAAATAHDVQLGVVLQRRFDPSFQAVRAAIATGALGQITLAHLSIPYLRPQSYYDQAAWRGSWALDGGGVLMNQGIHLIDLLVWLLGDPVQVQAAAATLQHTIEVEDTLVATLRFAQGALASVAATTTAAPGFAHRLEIYGSAGNVLIEGEQVTRWQSDTHSLDVPAAITSNAGAGSDPRGIAPIGHIRVLRDFIGAIHDKRAPLVDGFEGRRSLAAVLAMYRAAGLR
ncbi:Gfo/Idh/MocA family oxidoreductase [Candidatus Gracilibacteria bacterium]|nr:Gfo/Idh/MocA family oxidoreductase [Candidatus Gracilibacteria bacterium]